MVDTSRLSLGLHTSFRLNVERSIILSNASEALLSPSTLALDILYGLEDDMDPSDYLPQVPSSIGQMSHEF